MLNDTVHWFVSDDVLRQIVEVACMVSALVVIFLAQTVTSNAGLESRMQLLELTHRVGLYVLALALFYNAYDFSEGRGIPSTASFFVYVAFMFVCVIAVIHHRIRPQEEKQSSLIPHRARWPS